MVRKINNLVFIICTRGHVYVDIVYSIFKLIVQQNWYTNVSVYKKILFSYKIIKTLRRK